MVIKLNFMFRNVCGLMLRIWIRLALLCTEAASTTLSTRTRTRRNILLFSKLFEELKRLVNYFSLHNLIVCHFLVGM